MNQEHEPLAGLRQLPMSRAPDRDLWPGIEARLRPRRARRPAWLAAAASVLVMLGLVAQMVAVAPPEGGPTGDITTGPAPATQVALAPQTGPQRALVKANLKIAGHAERELLAALQAEPQSASLQRMLQTTRARQESLRAML